MLTFYLNKEWYKKIKSGQKTHEYRLKNDYWQTRILNLIKKHNGEDDYSLCKSCCSGQAQFSIPVKNCLIRFSCGYPASYDTTRTITAKVNRISLTQKGQYIDLKTKAPVFDIEFELVKD